jgi:hypothetical protein
VTEVTFEVGRVTPFLVSSRHNPEYPNPIAVDCKDHVAINASVTVATADGRLAETWSSGELFAADGQRLRFSGVIPAGRVKGSYRPTAVSGRTFSGLAIESTLTAAEFSGQLIEMFVGAGAAIAEPAVSW